MKIILNILAVIFVLGWIVGEFFLAAGFMIHVLLIFAVFSLIINFLTDPT